MLIWSKMRTSLLDPHHPLLKRFIENGDAQRAQEVFFFGPMPSPKLEVLNQRPLLSWEQRPMLFIDGGIKHLSTLSSPLPPPQWILHLGDGDSQTSTSTSKAYSTLIFPPKKDFSDLTLGLEVLNLWKTPPSQLHFFGFLGGDRGHEWTNIFEVSSWLKNKTHCTAHFDLDLSLCSPGRFQWNHQGRFSLLTLEKSACHLEGQVQYPITPEQNITPQSTHGLSNWGQGSFTWESDEVGLFFWGNS